MPEVAARSPTADTALKLLLMFLAAIGPFSLNIFKPCLPFIKADFDADIQVVQLGLSLAVLVSAVASAVAGPWADRAGRRPVLRASLVGYVASSLACTLAPGVGTLIAGRLVQAAASSVGLVLARAITADVYGGASLSAAITRFTLVAVGGVLFAPALGGVLIEAIGWRAVFGLTALIGVGAMFLARGRFGEPRFTTRREAGPPTGGTRLLLSQPAFVGYLLQSSFQLGLMFAYTSAAAYLSVDVLGLPATRYGFWFIASAALVGAGLQTGNVLSHRWSRGSVVLAGSALMLAGSLGLPRDPAALTELRLFLPALVAGLGMGVAFPASHAGMLEQEPHLAGTASGLMSFVQLAFAAAFAQLVVAEEASLAATLAWVMILGSAAAVGASLLAFRRRPT